VIISREGEVAARQRQPLLILEGIRKSLAASQPDPRWVPSVHRGHIESIGRADNDVPMEHFIDTTGQRKAVVNLLTLTVVGG
jgi:hypothetical protein